MIHSSNAAGTNPEALGPLGAWGYGLQAGVLAFVLQVDGAGDACHRLKANEVSGLPFRSGRRPNDCDRILGPEQRLYFLPARLDGKMRTTLGIAIQVGKAGVEGVAFEGQ